MTRHTKPTAQLGRTARLALLTSAASLTAAAVGLAAGSSAQAATSHDPFGRLDSLTASVSTATMTAAGWAADPDALSRALIIEIRVDGRAVSRTTANIRRPDVAAAHHTGPVTGYKVTVRTGYGTHTVCALASNVGAGASVTLGCASRTIVDPNNPIGSISPVQVAGTKATITGWAFDPNSSKTALAAHTTVDGTSTVSVPANRAYAAVNTKYHISGGHQFVSVRTLTAGRHTVCAYAMNIGAGSANPQLGCATITIGSTLTTNQKIAEDAARYVGYRYADGGASPATGFDCSGLTSYVYHEAADITLPHNAASQATMSRSLTQARALAGDLVFFHTSSGSVYHVAVYAGANKIYSAATPADGVRYQAIWSTAVTFGTVTHS